MNNVVSLKDFKTPDMPVTADDALHWLDSSAFAELAGVSARMANKALQRAVQGHAWKGYHLTVKVSEGASGRGGKRYLVNANSLPPEISARHYFGNTDLAEAPHGDVINAPMQLGQERKRLNKREREGEWKESITRPARRNPRGSKERAEAIKELIAEPLKFPCGKEKQVTYATVLNWINAIEQGGTEAAGRKVRADVGKPRYLISAKWDKACPLASEIQTQIVDEINRYIRSLWRSGVPGWVKAQDLASSKLVELCQGYGWSASPQLLTQLCHLPRRRIEAERPAALVAIDETDAKQFFDHYLPRVNRHRDGIEPMDIIVGDVHPMDVKLTRPDGSEVYARLIAWQDVATNRLWLTLVMLAKGEGVRREHVAMSFASMCEAWGLPKTLYLDNGSEYNWAEMINGFTELSRLTGQLSMYMMDAKSDFAAAVGHARDSASRSIVRARAYNAPAKPIEGLFSVTEQGFFTMLQGWVGGNRMRKKTHNVGKEPTAYSGSWEEFHEDVATMLRYYHATNQNGYLQGISPRDSYAGFIDEGWKKTAVSADVLLLAFANEYEPTIGQRRAGLATVNAVDYYHDALLPYTGRKLTVRVAKHDPRFAFCFEGRQLICTATIEATYGFLETAGAKEQQRRAKALRRVITEIKQDCDRLDLVSEVERHLEHKPEMPDAPVGKQVTVTAEIEQMAAALDEHAREALDSAASRSDPVKLDQWHSNDDSDEYTDAVEWLDD